MYGFLHFTQIIKQVIITMLLCSKLLFAKRSFNTVTSWFGLVKKSAITIKPCRKREKTRKKPKGSERIRKHSQERERTRKNSKKPERTRKDPKEPERTRKDPKESERTRKEPRGWPRRVSRGFKPIWNSSGFGSGDWNLKPERFQVWFKDGVNLSLNPPLNPPLKKNLKTPFN